MYGNMAIILVLSLVLRSLILIPFTSTNETKEVSQPKVKEDIVIIDTTKYDNLPINKLYVDLGDEEQTDNINWYYSNGTYILFLPKGYDRNNLRVSFYKIPNTQVSVYDTKNILLGTIMNNTSTDLFKNDEVIIKTDINSKTVYSYKVKVMQSDIPSISINLTNGASDLNRVNASTKHTAEATGQILVLDNDNNKLYTTLESFKGRGNRTWDKVKKPYQIKFEEKQDIYNMGKAKTYNLLANVLDGPMARNKLFYDLAQDIDLPYAVNSQPVELYINNDYFGSYLLTEKVQAKKNRVEIDEEEDFLVEIENHPEGDDYIRTNRGTILTIKSPDFDDLNRTEKNKVKTKVRNYMNKIENLVYSNASDEELMKYIDYDSFARFYWVQEISMNYDAMRGSNYFYTKDGKLYAGPIWDMDNTLNRSWIYGNLSSYYLAGDNSIRYRTNGNWYIGLLKRSGFSDKVDSIYYQYYDVINGLDKSLDDYLDTIMSSLKMNYTRRYFNTTITYRPAIPGNSTLSGSINLTKKYLNQRLNFYKNQYNGLIYKSFKYSYVLNDEEIENDLSLDNINTISSNINNIKIIGIDEKGNKKVLKEVSTDNIDKVEIVLSKNLSNVKRRNRITYTFEFRKDE